MTNVTTQAVETKVSKKAQAVALYNDLTAKETPRKDIIKAFQTDLGMSESGAKTYFGNIAYGNWGQPEVDPIEALGNLTGAQLTTLFNMKSDKPVSKFANKQEGIDRVKEIYGKRGLKTALKSINVTV